MSQCTWTTCDQLTRGPMYMYACYHPPLRPLERSKDLRTLQSGTCQKGLPLCASRNLEALKLCGAVRKALMRVWEQKENKWASIQWQNASPCGRLTPLGK